MGCSFSSNELLPSNFLSEKQNNNPLDKLQGSFFKHIIGVNLQSSNWTVESETNRNSILHMIRIMIRFYNYFKNSESYIVFDSLQLLMELDKDEKT